MRPTCAQNSSWTIFSLMSLEGNFKRWKIGRLNDGKNVGIGWNHILVVVHGANGQQPGQTAQFLAQKQLAQARSMLVDGRNRNPHHFLQQRVVWPSRFCGIEVQLPHFFQQLQR